MDNKDNKDNDENVLFQSIYKKNKSKELNKLKTYNIILDRCKKKIKWAADNDQYYILFEVPRFSFDCPLYDLSECTFFIKHKLKTKFQIIHFTPEDLVKLHNTNVEKTQLTHILLISWNHIKKHLNKLYY